MDSSGASFAMTYRHRRYGSGDETNAALLETEALQRYRQQQQQQQQELQLQQRYEPHQQTYQYHHMFQPLFPDPFRQETAALTSPFQLSTTPNTLAPPTPSTPASGHPRDGPQHQHQHVHQPQNSHSHSHPPYSPHVGHRMPEWSVYDKNGVPRELIVIEDTPEPMALWHAATAAPQAPARLPVNSSSTSSVMFQDAVPQELLTERQPFSTTTIPTTATTLTIAAAAARKRKFQDASLADQTSTLSGIDALRTLPAPSKTKSTTSPENARLTDPLKRRRTRYLQEQEAKSRHLNSLPPGFAYRGLFGPITRPGDVFIRAYGAKSSADKRKFHDGDGHYIVLTDAILADQYQIKKLLGQGTFGKVVEALDRKTNQLVAIKVIRSIQKYRDAAKIELRVLNTLRENNRGNEYRCITFRDCFNFYGHTCIVMDLLDSSLFDFLKENQFVPFPNSHIQSFARQLLTSVAFLHDLGLVHTDMKPENILLRDASFQTFTYHREVPSCRRAAPKCVAQRRVLFSSDICLVDFGSATFEDEYHSSVVATRHYRAPEVILGIGWSYPCDMWSVGCILVEMFTGDALFQTHDNLEHLAMMEAVLGERIDVDMVRKATMCSSKSDSAASFFKRLNLNFPNADTTRASQRYVSSMKLLEEIVPSPSPFHAKFLDLLRNIFVFEPSKRITAKDALQHPWFQEYSQDDGTQATKLAAERAQMAQRATRSQL